MQIALVSESLPCVLMPAWAVRKAMVKINTKGTVSCPSMFLYWQSIIAIHCHLAVAPPCFEYANISAKSFETLHTRFLKPKMITQWKQLEVTPPRETCTGRQWCLLAGCQGGSSIWGASCSTVSQSVFGSFGTRALQYAAKHCTKWQNSRFCSSSMTQRDGH